MPAIRLCPYIYISSSLFPSPLSSRCGMPAYHPPPHLICSAQRLFTAPPAASLPSYLPPLPTADVAYLFPSPAPDLPVTNADRLASAMRQSVRYCGGRAAVRRQTAHRAYSEYGGVGRVAWESG